MLTTVASSTTMSWARPTVPRISHRRGARAAAVPAMGTALALVSLIALTYRGSGVHGFLHGCGAATRCGRVRGRHEVVRESPPPPAMARISSRQAASMLPKGLPYRAVGCEQRRKAVVVAHHHRAGELAADRLDLDPVSGGPKVAHRIPPSSVLQCLHDWRSPEALPGPAGRLRPRLRLSRRRHRHVSAADG